MTKSTPIAAGTSVRFTANQLGLIESPSQARFEPETVGEGDTGTYYGLHPNLGDEGWHLIQVAVGGRILYAPVHESHFEASTGREALDA